MLRKHLLPKL